MAVKSTNIIIFLIAFFVNTAVQADELKFGISLALSGAAQKLGIGVKDGIETYFKSINSQGGVNGNRLSLIAIDDGYVPEAALKNVKKLIQDEDVIGLIGNVGTPTLKRCLAFIKEQAILMHGAFTGASIFRDSQTYPTLFNFRSSYRQETAFMIKGLLKIGIKPYEIAVFSQDDSFGDAGYNGVMDALKREFNSTYFHTEFSSPIIHCRYERNTLNVDPAILKIVNAEIKPKAIIMIGVYSTCAKFINKMERILPDTYFLNVSFVGSDALANNLANEAKNVFITQVVPHFSSDIIAAKEYIESLKKYLPNAKPGHPSFEGYLAAKVLVEGIKNSPLPITRENLLRGMKSIENYNPGLGKCLDADTGCRITYSGNDHNGLSKVWLTRIARKNITPIDWDDIVQKD